MKDKTKGKVKIKIISGVTSVVVSVVKIIIPTKKEKYNEEI